MAQTDFIIVRLREEENKYPLPFFFRHIPEKWRLRWIYYRLPLKITDILCMEWDAKEILLPITKEELIAFTKEEIRQMLHRIIMEQGAQNMVTEEILEPYLEKSLCIDGRMIPLFMFEEIFSYICYRHRITAKNCSPIIVAGDERETKIILKKLGTDKNRLTIVTSTPELYENYTDYMYNEYGLLVIRSKSPISSELYGNIVIELRETSKEEKKHYRKDSVVINLTGKKQTMFNRQKEKNIKIYDQFSFLVRGQKWDNKILQAAIFKTETGMGLAQLENAEKIKEVYGIMLEKDL